MMAKATPGVLGPIDVYSGMGGVADWAEKFPPNCALNSPWAPCGWWCDKQSTSVTPMTTGTPTSPGWFTPGSTAPCLINDHAIPGSGGCMPVYVWEGGGRKAATELWNVRRWHEGEGGARTVARGRCQHT